MKAVWKNPQVAWANSSCIWRGHDTGSDRTPALLPLSQNDYGGLFLTQTHERATAVFNRPWFIYIGKVPTSPPTYVQVPSGLRPGVHLNFSLDLGKEPGRPLTPLPGPLPSHPVSVGHRRTVPSCLPQPQPRTLPSGNCKMERLRTDLSDLRGYVFPPPTSPSPPPPLPPLPPAAPKLPKIERFRADLSDLRGFVVSLPHSLPLASPPPAAPAAPRLAK